MRAISKSWIGIGLAVLFGLSLFFFRGSSRYSNLFNSDNIVASISGTPISTTQFMRSLDMNINQFSQMLGKEISEDEIRAFQIHQLVIQNLINNAIFENEFDKINYILNDSTIAKETKKRLPNIYANNKINDDALNTFLKQQRLKIEDLVDIIDYETRSAKFDELFFNKNYPDSFQKKINLYNNQSRILELIRINYEDIKNINKNDVNKNNPDLLEFFNNKSINYMTDEERDLSYIIINKNSYKNIFIPSENKIIEYFNNNKKLFTRPENRSFKQFNFKSKDEAEKFKIKISGLSKEEIINYSNKNNIIFNNFENLNKNQVLDELSEVIFSLKINNVSKVVKTTLAYHVIFLENITLEKESSLEDMKDSIGNTITNIELENFFRDLKLKINQQILEGISLVEISKENNLIIETMKKEKYLNEENNDLNREIIDTAFNLKKDFISDIKDFNNEISFFVNVDEIYPSKSEKIENILDEVINDFIISKKISFSKKIFDENKNNNDLNKIIDIFNSKKEIIDLKKNDEILTASLRKIAFETELNNLAYHNDEDNIYFIKIKKINIPSDLNETSNIEIKSDLKNAFGNEIIKTKKITLNEELINGLLSQYK